jgi:hypothetical protein
MRDTLVTTVYGFQLLCLDAVIHQLTPVRHLQSHSAVLWIRESVEIHVYSIKGMKYNVYGSESVGS